MTDTAVALPPGVDTPPGGSLREVLAPRPRVIGVYAAAAIAVGLVLLFALPRPHANAVKVINPAKSIAVARTIPNFPLYLPSPLPAGWYPNSSRFSLDWIGAVLHIGYFAPGGGYIGLEQTTGDNKLVFVSTMSAGAVYDGLVTLDGQVWVHLQSDRKSQDSLAWYGPQSVVVVTGTTTVANLEQFAGSLHVGR